MTDDADIRVKEADRSLDMSRAKKKISEYDRNAIEAAVELKKAYGCEVVGLTVGSGLKAALKDALSRGLDKVVYVDDTSLADAGAGQTCAALAQAIKGHRRGGRGGLRGRQLGPVSSADRAPPGRAFGHALGFLRQRHGGPASL